MYEYIAKQLKRGIVMNILFCLLLVLAGTLFSLGAGLLTSALKSASETDEMFTTIALPDESSVRRYAVNQVEGLNEYQADYALLTRDHIVWGEYFDQYAADDITDKILREIEETVYTSPLVKLDPRRYMGAFSNEILPLNKTDKHNNHINYSGSAGQGAAFVARCVEISDYYKFDNYGAISGGGQFSEPDLIKSTVVYFDIEEIISIHPKHENPLLSAPKKFFMFSYIDADKNHMYKEGERYLIAGDYWQNGNLLKNENQPYISTQVDLGQPVVVGTVNTIEELDKLNAYDLYWGMTREVVSEQTDLFPLEVKAVTVNSYPESEVFKLGEMSYAEALNSEIGEGIRRAVEVADIKNRQLHVLTTENINSYFNFHQFRAKLTDGREFTGEEVTGGARVCIIPQELAEENGIEIGGVIKLTMYPNMFFSYVTSRGSNPYSGYRRYSTGTYYEEYPLSEQMEFEVVGMYDAGLPKSDDAHTIPLNTLFIPHASAEGVPEYTEFGLSGTSYDAYNPLLNVIVVPNGKNEEFSETIDAIIPGYSNFFKLYDQGYSIIKSAVENLTRNGGLIFILCAAGWIISLLVFCLFFVLRKKKDAGLLYALGVKRKDCFRWVFAHCLAVILVAQIVAFGASLALHEVSLDIAYQAAEKDVPEKKLGFDIFSNARIADDGAKTKFELARNPLVIVGAAGAQTLILLAVAGGMSSAMVKKGAKSLKGADI